MTTTPYTAEQAAELAELLQRVHARLLKAQIFDLATEVSQALAALSQQAAPVAVENWSEFKRQWAIDGMPRDKQRLAEAAFQAGSASPLPPIGGQQEAVGETYVEHGSGTTKVRWTAPAPAAQKECVWTPMDETNMPGTYEGSCGVAWSFIEGGLIDNETHYCPRCGGKIIDQAMQENKSDVPHS